MSKLGHQIALSRKEAARLMLDETGLTEPCRPPTVADFPDDGEPWLVRPGTIRMAWIAGIAALGVLLLVQLTFSMHGYFPIEEVFGFGAWFGFGACVALVLVARTLGLVLKRPDTYYDD